MNDRIKVLWKQAESHTANMSELRDRFAELIVRECAEVAGCNGHVSGFTLGDLIKEHFGVE